MIVTPFSVEPPSRTGPCGPAAWTPPLPLRREKQPSLVRLFGAFREFWRRQRSRRRLARLDAHLLKDIGLTYADAEFEANKPFWRQ